MIENALNWIVQNGFFILVGIIFVAVLIRVGWDSIKEIFGED